LDVVNRSEDAQVKLPHWLEPEWLEPIIDHGECIGTLVLIPDALRRKASAFQGGLPRYKLRRAVEFVDANLDYRRITSAAVLRRLRTRWR